MSFSFQYMAGPALILRDPLSSQVKSVSHVIWPLDPNAAMLRPRSMLVDISKGSWLSKTHAVVLVPKNHCAVSVSYPSDSPPPHSPSPISYGDLPVSGILSCGAMVQDPDLPSRLKYFLSGRASVRSPIPCVVWVNVFPCWSSS